MVRKVAECGEDAPPDEYRPDEKDVDLIVLSPLLLAACVEFVRKVERGEARSTKSYQQMKEAIAVVKGDDNV